jgi:hypothetical protein
VIVPCAGGFVKRRQPALMGNRIWATTPTKRER